MEVLPITHSSTLMLIFILYDLHDAFSYTTHSNTLILSFYHTQQRK